MKTPDAVKAQMISIAPIGYGTTSLMAVHSSAERLALLECAFESGIRHFDTAPYYGFGETERVVGEFVKNHRREDISLTTKFGIEVPYVAKSERINQLARRFFRVFPFIKKMVLRGTANFARKPAFTAESASLSLSRSLVALRTDYIDLFLLHEPSYDDATSEQMREFFTQETRRGRILNYGCGGVFTEISKIAEAGLPYAQWLQFADSVFARNIEAVRDRGRHLITFGSIKNPLDFLLARLEPPSIRLEWARQLGVDHLPNDTIAAFLQAIAHSRNRGGVVLISSRTPSRIKTAVRVATGAAFSREQISIFENLARGIYEAFPNISR